MTPVVPTNTAAMQNSDGVFTPSALISSGALALSPTWKVGLLRALPGDKEFCCYLNTVTQGPLYWERWSEYSGKAEGETQCSFTKVLAVQGLLEPFLLEKFSAMLPQNENPSFKAAEKAFHASVK